MAEQETGNGVQQCWLKNLLLDFECGTLMCEDTMANVGITNQAIGIWADIGEKNENILNIMYGFIIGRLFLLS